MKRIDAHQHFWAYNKTDYEWMGPQHETLRRDFMPADLAPLLGAIDFDGSVAVQARQQPNETEWLLHLADENERIMGVVGWIDLRSPQVQDQIDQFGSHTKLKGVRHVVHDEPDDDFMLGSDFMRGMGLLEAAGLTFDLLIFPRHISGAIKLVDAFPMQRFVVDHIAKPNIAERILSPWDAEIGDLARRDNVTCKVSGMVTEAVANWKPEDFAAYLEVIFEAFGPERTMIGSDWPVCTIVADYKPVMEIVLNYIERLSESDRQAVAGGTCSAFYGIGE